MCKEVITEHSLKSLKRAWSLQCCHSNKIFDMLSQALPRLIRVQKYYSILMSNERATTYMNIHLFTYKYCDVIKFDQFFLIFAGFLAIFLLKFDNFITLDKILTNGKQRFNVNFVF